MNTINRMLIGLHMIDTKLFSRKHLLSANFSLTHRCNFKCVYCKIPKHKLEEMSTDSVVSIIRQLKKIGVKRIQFTGGEPLLREDIGKITSLTQELGIYTTLNTNGWHLLDKINNFKVDMINISLDGDEKTQDARRKKGSYKRIINAMECLANQRVPFSILCTLDKNNLDQLEFLAELSDKHKAHLFFQVVVNRPYSADISKLAPNEKQIRDFVMRVIKLKKSNKRIGNSCQYLDYLLAYPNPSPLKCYAGNAFARIEADGRIVPCYISKTTKNLNLNSIPLEEAYMQLDKMDCKGCFECCYTEYNNIINFNLDTLIHYTKLIK